MTVCDPLQVKIKVTREVTMNTTTQTELMLLLLGLAFIPLFTCPALAQVTVEGQVAAVNGTPLEADLTLIRSGSTVELHHYHTDSQGAFSIETDQIAGQLLVAKADGYTSSEVLLKAESNARISVAFALWPSGTVTGRVVDEEGNGVGGATLHIHYANERRRHFLHHEMGDIHADDFGYFTLPVVARGRNFVVEAASEEHLPGSTDTLKLEEEKLDVQVPTGKLGFEVRGTVTDSAANPHEGVVVRMRLYPGDAIAVSAQFSRLHGRLLNRRTATDKDGAYEFKGLPGGRAVVIALVPGKTPVKQEKTLPEQGLPGDAYLVDLVVD